MGENYYYSLAVNLQAYNANDNCILISKPDGQALIEYLWIFATMVSVKEVMLFDIQ
jgi:hypothetical protein